MLALDGQVDVCCTLERAWELFCRFGDVAALIPSVEEVEVEGDRVYARVATKLGILPVSSRITLEVVERKPLVCLKAEGISYLGETIRKQVAPDKEIKGIDVNSSGRMRLHLDLRPGEREGQIQIIYHAEVEAEGRLKRIYESILKTKAPAMMEQFAENVQRTLEAAVEAATGEETATTAVVAEAVAMPAAKIAGSALVATDQPQPRGRWRRFMAWLKGLLSGRRRSE